jgi:hypothetical protein
LADATVTTLTGSLFHIQVFKDKYLRLKEACNYYIKRYETIAPYFSAKENL